MAKKIPESFVVRDMGECCRRCNHFSDKRSVGNCRLHLFKFMSWVEPYFAKCDDFMYKGLQYDKPANVKEN